MDGVDDTGGSDAYSNDVPSASRVPVNELPAEPKGYVEYSFAALA